MKYKIVSKLDSTDYPEVDGPCFIEMTLKQCQVMMDGIQKKSDWTVENLVNAGKTEKAKRLKTLTESLYIERM